MYLTYICIIIVLVSTSTNHALPISSSFHFDDNPSSTKNDLFMKRKEVHDPYGFNTILSRFIKRIKFDDIDKEESNDSLDFKRHKYDFI
ncbi:unnamed protein product [Rotaria sordida]|uniref:Uncharacterized protein n=1 Tax=Rotaria sordida TaxID=392033 RepID=A0A814VVX2_9BILA|nr:unnamed protein product [Rotaria sordida]CAF1195816.1 unnamed protein product [Rotaria sordida]CAF1237707.1 unnamed protein product [Rotaria sordida]CAF1465083.1 unnamed protein product [Rotaria sordida]CAF4028710.1 unnamed protein product [Rotaria sordida]